MSLSKLLAHTGLVLKAAVLKLNDNDPLRMAGATAFFTSFALPPIMMIIVQTLGLFTDRRTIGRHLSAQLSMILGKESTATMVQTIRSFRSLQHNYLVTAGLFIFLAFVATTLFRVIKSAINQLWHVRPRPGTGFLPVLRSRGLSLAVILLGGLLFLSGQFFDAGWHILNRYLMDGYPQTAFYLGACFGEVIVLVLSTVWFYVLFLLLPDARPEGGIALAGALITAALFNIGKWVLQSLLQPGKVSLFYGASGALVLVLLFVFYSSMILYFGAALIKAWSDQAGKPLRLRSYAMRYRIEEEEV